MSDHSKFQINERVVYPAHGVGEVIDIETQEIHDITMQVYVISFPHNKMTLRVPVSRALNIGLRRLASEDDIQKVYNVLNEKPKKGNKMWSRRAQEYEMKINSGHLVSIAEVVRDLYKNVENDRSYSERTIYESALQRLATEISVLNNTSVAETSEKLVELLKEKLALA